MTRQIATRFDSPTVASAAAALSLCAWVVANGRGARAFDGVAAAATAVYLAASLTPGTREQSAGTATSWGIVVAGVLPLALYGFARLAGRRSRGLSALASGVILAGNYLSRIATLEGGDQSADLPRDSFRPARRKNLPALESRDRARTTLQPTE